MLRFRSRRRAWPSQTPNSDLPPQKVLGHDGEMDKTVAERGPVLIGSPSKSPADVNRTGMVTAIYAVVGMNRGHARAVLAVGGGIRIGCLKQSL